MRVLTVTLRARYRSRPRGWSQNTCLSFMGSKLSNTSLVFVGPCLESASYHSSLLQLVWGAAIIVILSSKFTTTVGRGNTALLNFREPEYVEHVACLPRVRPPWLQRDFCSRAVSAASGRGFHVLLVRRPPCHGLFESSAVVLCDLHYLGIAELPPPTSWFVAIFQMILIVLIRCRDLCLRCTGLRWPRMDSSLGRMNQMATLSQIMD